MSLNITKIGMFNLSSSTRHKKPEPEKEARVDTFQIAINGCYNVNKIMNIAVKMNYMFIPRIPYCFR